MSRTTALADAALVQTLPAADYWRPEVHDAERHAVFGRSWLCLGSARPVAEPGSYLAETVAGWPVVVVRSATGLRAFHNVCRHRAGPLVDDGTGTSRSFVCRYHGWAYGLDGALRSARDSGLGEDELAAHDLDLRPLQVDAWRGLLFVCIDPDVAPLAEWLGEGFAEQCSPFPMESWEPVTRHVHDIAANWKAYGDNYLEGYHIPLVHPGLNKAIDAGSYQVDVADGWARHSARSRDGAIATGTWLWHWPNLALNLYEHGMSLERWLPTGPNRCRLVLDFCFSRTDPEAMARNQADVDSSAVICAEDKGICETVQRNLEAGSYDTGLLSPRHESGVADFQRRVRAARSAG